MFLDDTVAVPERDFIKTYSLLACQFEMSAKFAELAIQRQNHAEYDEHRRAYETSRDILSLSMFDCFNEWRKEDLSYRLPAWRDDRETPFEELSKQPLVVFSDGEVLEESDVPF